MLTRVRGAIGNAAAAALVVTGVMLNGMASAAAQPDLSTITVHPNDVTDSTAFSAAPPVMNPNGQPGISTVYTHRDGSRQITNTILLLSDPGAATAAADDARAKLAGQVVDSKQQAVAVGSGGTIVSGLTSDRSQSVVVLSFTEGNAFADITFKGAVKDPAPTDLVTEYGQQQDTAIKNALAG
jgi:hypothetical protein